MEWLRLVFGWYVFEIKKARMISGFFIGRKTALALAVPVLVCALFIALYPRSNLKMQTSELHQRVQIKLNDGRNGHSLSTSLSAEMGLLMSSQRASCIRFYATLPIFYVE